GLRGDPQAEVLRLEEAGVEQRRLSLALAANEPPGERAETDDAEREQRDHEVAALLPDEDPEHDPAHPDRAEDRADDVDAWVTRVRDVVHEPDPGEDDCKDPGEDDCNDHDLCIGPSKFPWIRDCIAGSRSDAPSPPTTAQKMMIGARLCDSVIESAPAA